MSDYVIDQVVRRLRQMPEAMQEQVLTYTQTLQASAVEGGSRSFPVGFRRRHPDGGPAAHKRSDRRRLRASRQR